MDRKIYLLRHGTPQVPDEVRRYIGVTDLPLSEQGKREAKGAGLWLRENAVNIGRVYASPLQRAWATAEVAAETAGLPEPVEAPELREIDLGQWENRPIQEVREQEPAQFDARGAHPWIFRTPNGETFREAAMRFLFFWGCLSRSIDCNILVVSHAGIMRAFLSEFMDWPRNDVLKMRMPVASLSILEEGGGRWQASHIGFLPDAILTDERIKELYIQYKTPENVILHMRAVADCAGEILDALEGEGRKNEFHRQRIIKAALLHDLIRTEKHHAERAATVLREEGYDEIAVLVGSHNNGVFDPDAPLGDSDILWYADKLVCENRRIPLEQRFAISLEKCATPEARKFHEQRWVKALNIQKKLKNRGVTL